MPSQDIAHLTQKIRQFRDARDWMQFHNPKDLAISLAIEAAELLEHFQWKNSVEVDAHAKAAKEEIADELADIAMYLFELADNLDIKLGPAMLRKMKKNAKKYPVGKARGKNVKYDKL